MRRRRTEHDALRRKRFLREQKAHDRKRQRFASAGLRHPTEDDDADELDDELATSFATRAERE